MVDKEARDADSNQLNKQWFIDLDWYDANNRSFFILARERLCPRCRKQLRVDEKEVPAADLLKAIKNCCASEPGYITVDLPVMESIFRLFLANGNMPLGLEELGQQLSEWYGRDTYRVPLETLPRLINKNRYYGLREAG